MKMQIIRPGIRTTCQDLGRPGYESVGIAPAGAADRISYALVNWLLGNSRNTPMLEVLLGDLELEVIDKEGVVAIGGAQMQTTINGNPIPNWSRFRLKKGDRIRMKHAIEGQIAYLGVQGGFECPTYFGSASVNLRESIGKALSAGKALHAPYITNIPLPPAKLHPSLIPHWDANETLRLRYLPAYQSDWFDRSRFENGTYIVSAQHDKMGYRLIGPKVPPRHTHLISEGIVYGAIQITHDGDPIVLMSEHQTIGGYPKIGTIIPRDGYALSQMPTGAHVFFEAIDETEARSLLEPISIDEIPWFPFEPSSPRQ